MTEQYKLFSSFGILRWKYDKYSHQGRGLKGREIKARITFSKIENVWTVIS